MSSTRSETENGSRKEKWAARLASARAEYVVAARAGRGGRATQAGYAAGIDDLVRRLAESAGEDLATVSVVVCALGGYGRRTLCLHSDLDLLLVFDGPIGPSEERFVNRLLQPLWDLKLTVGHHVRELRELDQFDDGNPEFLLALCDLRLLTGDVRLFDEVFRRVQQGEMAHADRVIDALLALGRERRAEFNDTLYQLEPDVKNAPGGLRDIAAIHLMRQLARETFATERTGIDHVRINDAEDFLLRIRSVLHLDAGRDMNLLTYEAQERVAEVMGYSGAEPRQRVEHLMRDYFLHARAVARGFEAGWSAVRPSAAPSTPGPVTADVAISADGVRFTDPVKAAGQPAVWLEAFQVAIANGCLVSEQVMTLVQENVGRYTTDYFVATDEDRLRLRTMLHPTPGLSARLADMLDCGLLGTIFPEFEKIHCRVIRDFYHKYTVDEHTLLTIRNLESLWHPASASRARFSSILNEVNSPELLTLALLYHDVGKWKDENHATESLRLARPMLARLQLPTDAKETVEFLIEHHLIMSRVAFRSDFGDPDTVAQLAANVGNEEWLKMLCLLTICDIEAVAPGTLTPWKEDLMWRVYVDAYNHLTLGYADELIQKDQTDRAMVVADRPADIAESELSRFLDGLPRRYLAVFGHSAIYRHVRLARGLMPDEIHASLERRDDIWELTVAALDKPYLFSNISGVLSYFGMDIHRGQAMTTPDHLALDVFEFSDGEGFLRQNTGAMDEISRVLKGVVAGTLDVATLLRGRVRSILRKRRPMVRTIIHFDNEHSHKYTALEIITDDAPGLLYRISRAISDQGCDVDLVLISTEGHKAIDVLHVTKASRKLDGAQQLALEEELKRALEAGYETD